MNPPKGDAQEYINFLVATRRACRALEAGCVQGGGSDRPAADAVTRLLHRLEPDPQTLWREAKAEVILDDVRFVFADSTLDHLSSREIELVGRHWSGNHHTVVRGLKLMRLVWTDGDRHLPVSYRLTDKGRDQLTTNDHFQEVVDEARGRGYGARRGGFDRRPASLPNLKRTGCLTGRSGCA